MGYIFISLMINVELFFPVRMDLYVFFGKISMHITIWNLMIIITIFTVELVYILDINAFTGSLFCKYFNSF